MRYTILRGNWATVTVTDSEGRRHSVDVQANSTFDAAHLYLVAAKGNPASGMPVPTGETIFEVVVNAKVYKVTGTSLGKWIQKRRQELKGPAGYLFSQRAVMD